MRFHHMFYSAINGVMMIKYWLWKTFVRVMVMVEKGVLAKVKVPIQEMRNTTLPKGF